MAFEIKTKCVFYAGINDSVLDITHTLNTNVYLDKDGHYLDVNSEKIYLEPNRYIVEIPKGNFLQLTKKQIQDFL